MKGKHLTDQEIQELAFEGSAFEVSVMEHLQSCDLCSLKVENYTQVLLGIKGQPNAGFGFDLSTLVISQIVKKQGAQSHTDLFWFLGIIGAITVGIVAYLFGLYVSTLFSRVSGMGFYLVITTASILLVFLGIDAYQKYKRQLNTLDFF